MHFFLSMLPDHWNWYMHVEFYFYVLAIPGYGGYLLWKIERLFEHFFPKTYWKPGFRFTRMEILSMREHQRRMKKFYEEKPRALLKAWELGYISHFGVLVHFHKWEHAERRKYGTFVQEAWHLEQLLLTDEKYIPFRKKHERVKAKAQSHYARWYDKRIVHYPKPSKDDPLGMLHAKIIYQGFLGLLYRYVLFVSVFVYWGAYIEMPEGWFWTVAVIRFCLIYFYKVYLFGEIHVTPEELGIIHLYS